MSWKLTSLCLLSLLIACGEDGISPAHRSLTVVSYGGGDYQKSHKLAFIDPFASQTKTTVTSVVWNADYGMLKTMVESGDVTWDVVDVTSAHFTRGVNEHLYEKLPRKPEEGDFFPGSVSDYGVASVYWGTVLAFRKDGYKGRQPSSWADFWNTSAFPGARALYDDPRGNLEFALLADGVPKDRLYPLDVERAFKKLTEIKPHIRVWWSDGTQPVQMLLNSTVALTSAWNGRLYASQQARSGISYTWNGSALELDYWVIPRGSKSVAQAARFIAFASSPSAMARQAGIVGYGPVNKKALSSLPVSVRSQLPTADNNWQASFVVDAEWWTKHEEAMKARWLEWKTK